MYAAAARARPARTHWLQCMHVKENECRVMLKSMQQESSPSSLQLSSSLSLSSSTSMFQEQAFDQRRKLHKKGSSSTSSKRCVCHGTSKEPEAEKFEKKLLSSSPLPLLPGTLIVDCTARRPSMQSLSPRPRPSLTHSLTH